MFTMFTCLQCLHDKQKIKQNDMAKKKEFGNPINLDNLMRQETGQKPPAQESKNEDFSEDRLETPSNACSESGYKHCAFICSAELWGKMQAIAQREGFTIRQVMEHWMRTGISSYEAKHGTVKPKDKRDVGNVL